MFQRLWQKLSGQTGPDDQHSQHESPQGATMNHLAQFRDRIDDFMGHHPQSPLDADQRVEFEGLPYYEENKALAITAVVTPFPADEPLVEMETSTGSKQLYRRWGRITFPVADETAELTIYSDPTGHDLFMPFKDATNGKVSYGAGRYLDSHRPGLEQISDTQVEVDFNYCYNPYCAYSPAYTCPLPPSENWLKVPIEAGEKKFQEKG